MIIDLFSKSNELKEFVSQFETTMFLGDLSSLINFIRSNDPIKSLEGLSSPQRQLLYLAGLNVNSSMKSDAETKAQFSDDELEHMKKLLNEIEQGYEQFFYPKSEDEVDEEWKSKRSIAMPTFLDYFNQGLLNYEEQIIERIEEYFTPFNKEINAHFKLEIIDFINIYNYIDKVPNNFLMEKINRKEGQKSWEEICTDLDNQGLMPWEWNDHLPQHQKDYFDWMYDKGSMNRFSKQDLINNFGTKAEDFLNILTWKRTETNFLYYTDKNILYSKPLFDIDQNTFQIIDRNYVINAIYNTLLEFCVKNPLLNEKFYAIRGLKLEEKTEKIFNRFFKNKAHVHKGYFTEKGHEQDLLFLYEGLALIIEAKSSKRDEPRRDPDKAYPLIVSNFEETIQKGYDQALRVKSNFLKKKVLNIFKDQNLKQPVIDIRTKNYHSVFCIVVTLERFGQIQTDLSRMLEIDDDDNFPWSICIDDLEVFLLMFEKLGKRKSELIKFLIFREKLHGRLISGDELEVCGAFIQNKITNKQLDDDKLIFTLAPDLTEMFDTTYQHKGLGFDNEKNLNIKTSGRFISLGGF